jgi:hypothetical protein
VLGIVSKELEVDGLRVFFINQSRTKYKPMSLGLMESLFAEIILKETNDNV